jgi:hypothetical protein
LIGIHLLTIDSGDDSLPLEADAKFKSPGVEQLVKDRSANTKAAARRKVTLDRGVALDETDSPQGKSSGLKLGLVDAKLLESGKGIGHEAFTAGLVDRRLSAVDHLDAQTA